MRIKDFNTDDKVLIIAEIGNNHEGNFNLAKEMVDMAIEAGADAIKFQTFKTKYYVSQKNQERFKRLKSYELTENQFEELSIYINRKDKLFLSTPFDIQSAKFLSTIVPAFKISSADNTFFPLIEVVANTGLPIILSSGLTDLARIKYTEQFIYHCWRNKDIDSELAVLHCITSYPVPRREANLKVIQQLIQELRCTIGYSDHTLGVDASILSVALGARIIEKHFTIDKNYSNFRDHQLSANKEELQQMIKKIRETEELLGTGNKILQNCEKENEIAVRRSITANMDLKKGTVINSDNVMWVRPGEGLPPGQEFKIFGKKLIKGIKEGDFILSENCK